MRSEAVSLGDLIANATPGFACGDNLEEGIFQIRMNNLSRDGRLLLDARRRVPSNHKSISKRLLEPGDILFNTTNSPNLVGKTALFTGCDEPAVYSNHFLRLRTDETRLDPGFLTRWLHLEFQRGVFEARCKQWVNQATFGKDRLFSLRILLPPIEEQRRIAGILDAADALRAKRRQALAKLDTLTQAIFIDMFGDPVANDHGWQKVCFEDLCPSHLGKMLDQKQQTGLHSRPYLRNTNVRWLEFDLTKVGQMDFDEIAREKYRLVVGDVLICEGGEPGRAAVWRGDLAECYFQKALHRGRPDPKMATPEFVVHLLRRLASGGGLVDHISTATIAHLTGKRLKTIRVIAPPIELQRVFTERSTAVEQRRHDVVTSESHLDTLFASLQQRAFRGEL